MTRAMMILKKMMLLMSVCLFASCLVHATGSIGFVTDPTDGTVYAFNVDDTSTLRPLSYQASLTHPALRPRPMAIPSISLLTPP